MPRGTLTAPPPPQTPRSLLWVDMLAGAAAGAVTKTLVAPLERAKVVLQVQGMSASPQAYTRGVAGTVRQLAAAGGLSSLYAGNGANVARVIPVYALKFGLNDYYQRALHVVTAGWSPAAALLTAGVATGLTQQCLTLPLEVIRTRLNVGRALQPPLEYKGIAHCASTIVRTEGVRGLYKGLVPTLWTGVPFVALQLTLVGLLTKAVPPNREGGKPSGWWLVPVGIVAGVTAQVATYPGDTVRKLMITNGVGGAPPRFASTLDCCRQVYARTGLAGFYGGLGANVARAVPECAVQFAAYRALSDVLRTWAEAV
jgi:solute carrier family 25 (mitochondrial phosphate transporter), member 23/24/25/41